MKRPSHKARAGYTLVELMVALTVGGLVISTMYAMGTGSIRHFQMQHQVANMQSALRFAMIELRRDLARAGLHGTPWAQRDGCGAASLNFSTNPLVGGDGWIAAVSSFRNDLAPNLVDTTGQNRVNGFHNDEITVIGNFATTNEYGQIQFINANTIQLNVAPAQALHALLADFGWNPVTGAAQPAVDLTLLQQAFPRNGLIAITMNNGQDRHYATLVNPATMAGNVVTLTFAPAIPGRCDFTAVQNGWVAPLQVVRYGAALTADANAPESDRATGQIAQLLRTQRLPSNKNILMPGSVPRVVLDYLAAFDVSFTMTAATGVNAADLYTIGQTVGTDPAVNNTPDLIRAITVRLAVRAPSTDPGIRFLNCGNLSCFQIFPGAAGAPAARVRWLRTEVFLPSLAAEGW